MIPSVEIKILDDRLRQDEFALKYATPGSVAVDLRACVQEQMTFSPGEESLIPCGFSMQLPENTAAILLPRSGLGHKEGIILGNTAGVIDFDYQGQVMLSIWNRNRFCDIIITPMMRVAQMLIMPIIKANFKVVPEFSRDSERGAGGFGSTGLG